MSGFIKSILDRHSHPGEIKPRLRMIFEKGINAANDQISEVSPRDEDPISGLARPANPISDFTGKAGNREEGTVGQNKRKDRIVPPELEDQGEKTADHKIGLHRSGVVNNPGRAEDIHEINGQSGVKQKEQAAKVRRIPGSGKPEISEKKEQEKPGDKSPENKNKEDLNLNHTRMDLKPGERSGNTETAKRALHKDTFMTEKSEEVISRSKIDKIDREAGKVKMRETLIRPKLSGRVENNLLRNTESVKVAMIPGVGREEARKNKEESPGEKVVNINIGRIEIRAVKQTPVSHPAAARPEQKKSSLNEYLKQRDM